MGGDDPFAVYCDMETDGGGWTLVGNAISGENTAMYDQNPNPFNGFQEAYALNYDLTHDWALNLSRFSETTIDVLVKYSSDDYVLVTNVKKADLQEYRKDGQVSYTMVAKNTYDNVEHSTDWWCGTSSGAWRICIGTSGTNPFYSLWHSDDCYYGQRIDGSYRPGCDESHETYIR